jgi:REP element-mobilizing transposase RayT
MPHTFFVLHMHVVFSTKHRRPLIGPDLQVRLWPYLGSLARDKKLTPLIIGGTDNHIHMLMGLPALTLLPHAMRKIKACSSKWVNDTFGRRTGFAWQEGYGAFAIAASQVDRTIRYIRGQAAHHRRVTFEEEYIAFLKRNNVDYDPAVVFG